MSKVRLLHLSEEEVIRLIALVDDIIFTRSDVVKQDIRRKTNNRFSSRELSQMKYFLGNEIAHSTICLEVAG